MTKVQTFLIGESLEIKRQEGDLASLEFGIPEVISLIGRTIQFAVKTRSSPRQVIFRKEGIDWEIDDQTIYTVIEPEDTRGHSGIHYWELQVTDANDKPISIGRGNFIITPELIVEE